MEQEYKDIRHEMAERTAHRFTQKHGEELEAEVDDLRKRLREAELKIQRYVTIVDNLNGPDRKHGNLVSH